MEKSPMEALGYARSGESCQVCGEPGLWINAASGWESCDARRMETRRRGYYDDWPLADLEALREVRFGMKGA